MHACPCCGYRTLPGRGDYDLCPVCWWEDDGGEPWEFSGPNARTLVEAQQEYLAERRPYRRRPGKVRRPRPREAREPGWRPYDLTDDLAARVRQSHEEQHRHWDSERQRTAQEIEDEPEGPFKEFNAAMLALEERAGALSHVEVKAQVRALVHEHALLLPEPYLEMQSRLLKHELFYRRHPAHAVCWVLRHGRPGSFRRRWRELRSGTFHVVG